MRKNLIEDNKGNPTYWTSENYTTSDILESYGFVYIISTHDYKKYIGKCRTFESDGTLHYKYYRGSGRDLKRHYTTNNHDYSLYTFDILEVANSKEKLKELEQHYIIKYNAKNSDDFLNLANADGLDSKILNIPNIKLKNIVGSYSSSICSVIKKYFVEKPDILNHFKSTKYNDIKELKARQISVSYDLNDIIRDEAKRLDVNIMNLVRLIFVHYNP